MNKVVVVPITVDNEVDLMYDVGIFDFPYFEVRSYHDRINIAKQIVYQYYSHAYDNLKKDPFPFVNRKCIYFNDDMLDVFVYKLPFGEEFVPNRQYVRPKMDYIMNVAKIFDKYYLMNGSFQSSSKSIRKLFMTNMMSDHSLFIMNRLY